MTVTDHLRAHLLENAGMCNLQRHDIDSLRETEWSARFEQLMRNRLVLGAMRYGKINAPGKPRWDRVKRAQQELAAYVADGNLERLVDVANSMLLEFEEGRHPQRHWRSGDGGFGQVVQG